MNRHFLLFAKRANRRRYSIVLMIRSRNDLYFFESNANMKTGCRALSDSHAMTLQIRIAVAC